MANFFVSLGRIIRCAVCRRKFCYSKYQIGSRQFYSGLGFVRTTCPKTHTRGGRNIISTIRDVPKVLENINNKDN